MASAIPSVEPYLSAKSETVRGAAVQALRLMTGEKADTLIARTLVQEKNKRVRRSAVDAMELRSPSDTLVTTLQNTVTSDPDVKVRRKALALLKKWYPDRPGIQTSLQFVAKNDARTSLREEARNILENQ